MSDFNSAATLAGYFVAHGVWSVADGVACAPLVAYEGPDGRGFKKFDTDAGAAGRAEEWLSANPQQADRAVMVVDGYAELDGIRHDALIARVVEYGPPCRTMHVVVPYRPAGSTEGFAVHSPRFGAAEGVAYEELDSLSEAFFAGVISHTAASPIWTSHLDESV